MAETGSDLKFSDRAQQTKEGNMKRGWWESEIVHRQVGERESCADIWRKGIQAKNSLCKVPGAGWCLACWRNGEEAHTAAAERARGKREEGRTW